MIVTLKEQFQKKVPWLEEDIINSLVEAAEAWLQDHRKATMDSLHNNTTPDSPGAFMLIPCVTFIDRTLLPSLSQQDTKGDKE